jgi:hypothetical protein
MWEIDKFANWIYLRGTIACQDGWRLKLMRMAMTEDDGIPLHVDGRQWLLF